MPPTPNSRQFPLRFITRLLPCALTVIVLWCGIGWRLQSTPGWLAVTTGLCVGLCSNCNRDAGDGRQSTLIHLFLMAIVCWGLILAGRFAGTIASVNHSEVWRSYRTATDTDGITLLADEAAAASREAASSGANPTEVSSQTTAEQSVAELQRGREIWNSLSDTEKQSVLQRWRAKAIWVDKLAWSMIIQRSVTEAYQGVNLYWHLFGLAAAIGVALILYRSPDH